MPTGVSGLTTQAAMLKKPQLPTWSQHTQADSRLSGERSIHYLPAIPTPANRTQPHQRPQARAKQQLPPGPKPQELTGLDRLAAVLVTRFGDGLLHSVNVSIL